MPEAEELIIDAARHAGTAVHGFWRRRHAPPPTPTVFLRDVRTRLEMLIDAVLGCELPVRAAQAAAPMPLLRRLFTRGGRKTAAAGPLPATDGTAVFLPPSLPVSPPASAAFTDDYCLLALLQALHHLRGSAGEIARLESDLARDLYLIAEAAAVDHRLRRLMPGWSQALDALYVRMDRALAQRRLRDALEADVAARYRNFLRGRAGAETLHANPAAALDWANAQARALRLRVPARRYVAWLGDLVVGRLLPPEGAPRARVRASSKAAAAADARAGARTASLVRRPRVRDGRDEDDAKPGVSMVQTSEPHPHAEDPFGLNRPEDQEPEDDLGGAAESLAEMEEARLVHSPGAAREAFEASDPPPRLESAADTALPPCAFSYPEWDCRTSRYRENAVALFSHPAKPGGAKWVADALQRNAGLLAQIRRRLGAIRPDRTILRGQTAGDEIDLDAVVAARGERRAGATGDARFYRSRRPAPRTLALVLLVDASASTDAWVTRKDRVIDIEKEAALLAAAGLETLRTRFAVLAFSGEGPAGVQIREIKRFDETWDASAQRRLAGLEPDRYTRLGAALRHANALLAACAADHRLLLLLSDGRPNDCDRYASRYGIEDARQALTEARLKRISPYCFTVDRAGGSYLPTIFGSEGYTVVQHPQQLPVAFINWLRRAARVCMR
ncbi:nitric oxide reductase activase protein [Thiobacillus denitrificans ATCC 25259]|uniref:Nitric oxide reductase activase protein n=1 Tax=Thiobacillus denitrificans (strain ATCC 25259 / T1) TaxID=292415 RepID=Q3SKK1_THIDA|nr:VWA domain-containing protein [Thiobacillus denitrificans]AAZ96778.1 nitric oxide reductase activase protein [Thiobacillus denitrificans ATCC 25259]